ncbi:TetR family transcriptional regulator C-terminal domain-containing protein [Nonomuraea angiospora]|uniref:TetR family transcriptional regulator C-terminal domain-containing protein n=1 Tax=Nonomuraea angiospora TaxID=46172 RepID=UPI00344CE9B5
MAGSAARPPRDLQDEQHVEAQFQGVEVTARQWLTAFCRRNETQPGLVRLFTVQSAESLNPAHPAHEFFYQRNQRVRERIARLIIGDQEKGRLSPSLDPAATAAELVSLMNGLQLQWLRDPATDMCGLFETSLLRHGSRTDRLVLRLRPLPEPGPAPDLAAARGHPVVGGRPGSGLAPSRGAGQRPGRPRRPSGDPLLDAYRSYLQVNIGA